MVDTGSKKKTKTIKTTEPNNVDTVLRGTEQ